MNRRAWNDLRPYLGRPYSALAVLAVASVVAGFGESVILVMVVRSAVRTVGSATSISSSLLPSWSPRTMLLIAAIGAVVVIVLHWVVAVISARLTAGVQHAARRAVINAFLGAEWSRQSLQGDASLHETIAVLVPEANQLAHALMMSLSAALALVVLMVVAFVISPMATLFVLLFGLAVFGVLRPLMTRSRRLAGAQVSANAAFVAEVARTTSMAMELKVFGVQGRTATHLDDAGAASVAALERARRVGRFNRNIYKDLAMFVLVGAVFAMTNWHSIDVSALGAVVLLVVRAVQGAQNVYEAGNHAREMHPAMVEMQRRIDELAAATDVRGDVEIDRFDRLELTDASYRYHDEVAALQHVDLTIRAGEILGVVGPSGGGKTTLTQLILALRRPTSGTVTVNGRDVRSISQQCWSRLVSLVPQEPQLMEGTVLENIVFWRDGITREQAVAAARAAHVHDDITALPDGFDTMLAPGGRGLSGGQKQRVAIARALAGNPSLLVLDEPTSALDASSEALVRETLAGLKGKVAVVVVAHRPTTLQVCDSFVTIEAGTIVDRGDAV